MGEQDVVDGSQEPSQASPIIQDVNYGAANIGKMIPAMAGFAIRHLEYPYNQKVDLLASGTGVPAIDQYLPKIQLPEMRFEKTIEDGPVFKMLNDFSKSNDYLNNKFKGQSFPGLVGKAMSSTKNAAIMSSGMAGLPQTITSNVGNQQSVNNWKDAGEYLAHSVIREAPPLIAMMAATAIGHPEAGATFMASQKISSQYEKVSKAKNLSAAQQYERLMLDGAATYMAWSSAPELQGWAGKIYSNFGMKAGSDLVKMSVGNALKLQFAKVLADPSAQMTIAAIADTIATQLLDSYYKTQERTINEALVEVFEAGAFTLLTGKLLHGANAILGNILEKKPTLKHLLAIKTTIHAMIDGLEDSKGNKLTMPSVIQDAFSVINLLNKTEDMIKGGHYTDHPHDLVGFQKMIQHASKEMGESGYVRVLGGYSTLEDVVNSKVPNRATPEQILNTLAGAGVPKEEMDDMGLQGWLQGKQMVEKKDLVNYLQGNEIKVTEVQKGGLGRLASEKEKIKIDQLGNKVDDAEDAYHKSRLDTFDALEKAGMSQVDRINMLDSFERPTSWRTREQALSELKKYAPDYDFIGHLEKAGNLTEARENLQNARNLGLSTKFQQYQLPGGTNYREVLLTLPEKNPLDKSKTNFTGTSTENFRSGHWDEPNVLAHVRLNDRVIDGKKTLFVEEVQSDWHQKGREQGYGDPQAWIDSLAKDYPKLNETPKEEWSLNVLKRAGVPENLREQYWKLQGKSVVPDAPFKKSWPEIVMKRVLKMAVDEGYEKIAFTTGEQQSERYDLSKYLNEVSVVKHASGTEYSLTAEGKDGRVAINREVVSREKLADYVGKDLANKIIQDTAGYNSDSLKRKVYSSLDLKVGGEGMKGFYDQIIPSFLNKYTKKWGGRVRDEQMRTTSKKKALKVVRNGVVSEPEVSVHTLEITPFMAKALKQGQANYGLQGKMPKEGGFARISKDAKEELTDEERIQLGIMKPKASEPPKEPPTKIVEAAADGENEYVKNTPLEINVGKNDKGTAKNLREEFTGIKNEQIARGSQLAEKIRAIVPSEEDRKGMFWIKAANGKKGMIIDALQDEVFKPYHKELRAAIKMFDDPAAQEALRKVEKYYAESGQVSKEIGSIGTIRENYMNRIYTPEPPKDFVKTELRKGLRQTTQHRKQRVFENEFDAIRGGKQFATTDIADALSIHNEEMARVNASIKLADAMGGSGIAMWAKSADGINAPEGWIKVGDIRKNGAELYAPKGISDGLKAITDPDYVKRIDALKNLAKFQGLIKTVKLSMSFFHHLALSFQAAYQGNLGAVLKTGFLDGNLKSKEFFSMEQDFAKHTGITSVIDSNKDILHSLLKHEGDNWDKLTELPLLKQYFDMNRSSANFLFGKLQRYLKVMDFGRKSASWIASHPEASNAEVKAAKIGFSKEINAAYGGLNWEAMGVSKSSLSLLRMVLLAPDWTISNVQLFKQAIGDWGKIPTAGNAARLHITTALLGGITLTEAFNKMITGHFTDKNKKGHQLEVEIAPNVYFSFLKGGIGDITKLSSMIAESGAKGVARFAQGKLSPIASTAIGALENVKYSNVPIAANKKASESQGRYATRATFDYLKYIAGNLGPVPIGAGGVTQYLEREKDKTVAGGLAVASGIGRFSPPSKKKSKSMYDGYDFSKFGK